MNAFSVGKMKLKHQLVFLILLSVVGMAVIQLYYYVNFYYLITERAKVYTSNLMSNIKESVTFNVQNMKEVAFTTAYNSLVQEFMDSEDDYLRHEASKVIFNIIENIGSSNKNIYDIILIDNKERLTTIKNSESIMLYNQIAESFGDTFQTLKVPCFTSVMTNEYRRQIGVLGRLNYFAYIMPVFSAKEGSQPNSKIGTCIVICNLESLNNSIGRYDIPPKSLFMILDAGSTIIAANEEKIIGKQLQAAMDAELGPSGGTAKGGRYGSRYESPQFIIQEEEIEHVNWKITCINSVAELTSDMQGIKTRGLLMSILAAVCLIIIGYVFMKNLVRPIARIIRFMESFDRDMKTNRLKIAERNELGQLSEYVNRMLDRIDKMNNEVLSSQTSLYEMNIAKKQAELASLQSQINPHFLYNTLDCMRGIGLAYNVKEVAVISSAMSKIFRYCIKEADYVKVRDEVECIKDYMKIMSIRFMNKIQTCFAIEDRIMDMKILKMVLQPVVENAVYHGLERKEGEGALIVRGYCGIDNTITIEVFDDGIGMEENELELLMRRLDDTSMNETVYQNEKRSIGLFNISTRIKLTYGKEYGLRISSSKNSGTSVFLSFPGSFQ